MDRAVFEDILEFAESLFEIYDELPNGDIGVVCHYDYASQLVKDLALFDLSLGNIELHDYDLKHYDKEFLISICNGQIDVEPYYRNESSYFEIENTITFIHGDANSKICKYIVSPLVVEFGFKYDEDDELLSCEDEHCKCGCCGDCPDHDDLVYESQTDSDISELVHISRDNLGEPEGFTKSWSGVIDGVPYQNSFSYYSSDKDELHNIADSFGVHL